MAVEKIIFDLGRVLVKFNVRNLFRKIITTEEEIDYFLQNICTWEWHIQQDLVLMRVNISAIGSFILINFPLYQLALITPGTSPCMMRSRSFPLAIPNLL